MQPIHPHSAHEARVDATVWFALLFAALMLIGARAAAARNFKDNPNYLDDVSRERAIESTDMVVLPPPPSTGPSFNERVFNAQLNKEFRDRYEETFGRTEEDQIYNLPNRYTFYNDLYGFRGSPQDQSAAENDYAQFVIRRLAEYHVGNYAEHDPSMKTAWQAKQRVENMKVEVGQVSLDAQYSIAGNSLDLKVNNPYFSLARVRLQMDPGRIGPAPMQEATISLGRNFTPRFSLESHWMMMDGVFQVIGREALNAHLGSTISTSTFTLPRGVSMRESKYLAGLSYIF